MKKILFFLFFIAIGLNPNVSAAQRKLIVLTFDGGPKPEILFGSKEKSGLIEILKSFRAPAHFFMVGIKAETYPDAVQIVSQNGFLIENHSYGHENMVKLLKEKGETALIKNVTCTNEAIFYATGRHPKYFRPPYWITNGRVETLIETIGLKIVTGPGRPDVNTLDYDDYEKNRPPEVLIKRIKKTIAVREKEGIYKHVFVFHELPNTVEALKVLIPYFLEHGYHFGTLDEFFTQ